MGASLHLLNRHRAAAVLPLGIPHPQSEKWRNEGVAGMARASPVGVE